MQDSWLERRQDSVIKRQKDHRSPYQRDRARILHSAAFRRLQSKTQIMGSGHSDFHRSRLTHSLEASQIGSGITAQLKSKYAEQCAHLLPESDALIEALCLAHDIGHPPFGHGGETALNYMMRDHGGFEGNGQTLRILAKLEPYTENYGMNLTRRSLLGVLKYPQTINLLTQINRPELPTSPRQLKSKEWHPPKGIYTDDLDILDWVLAPLSSSDKALFQSSLSIKDHHKKTQFKSLDCSIMELADDIAYGIHDLEDAIESGFISRSVFDMHVVEKLSQIDDEWLREYALTLATNLFSDKHHKQKEAIGGLVNYLITSIDLVDLNAENNDVHFAEPLLQFNAKLPEHANQTLQVFKDFVLEYVIKQTRIQRKEYRGQQLIMEIFEAINSDPLRLLPTHTKQRWLEANNKGLNPHRVIADYVSGMTDTYATQLYQTLFLPHNPFN